MESSIGSSFICMPNRKSLRQSFWKRREETEGETVRFSEIRSTIGPHLLMSVSASDAENDNSFSVEEAFYLYHFAHFKNYFVWKYTF